MSFLKKQLSASLEDYLEAIYVLLQSGNVARSKDIAEHLQVSAASVTGALRTLAERQLIHYKPYGYITLTDKGQQAASR
ncbi:MAG: metal-dependent transcriptional regulator, partial [Planctomycetes bacterium]|nr:metal-dependent transcriptional regulator [Planctomycetota bacterium]